MSEETHIDANINQVCRDCFATSNQLSNKCPACHKPRVVQHAELFDLSIAHLDCDAFFASVEKRDNPALRDKPLIIGGNSNRGVVSTACYIARMSGVRSAMPIYQAKKHCPDGVFMSGNMAKYKAVGQEIRGLMQDITPLVEPLSIDEAFMDLSGTEKYHDQPPVLTLMKLAQTIEKTIGITVSIGLAPNKFLAKLASDMQKPRGFTVIGDSDAVARLAPMPINRIYGIGKVTNSRLKKDGLSIIAQLQEMEQSTLVRRYGETGLLLYNLARGIDKRAVNTKGKTKSISSETTLERDTYDRTALEKILWRQCEKTSREMKQQQKAAATITLKVKTHAHKTLTRSKTLDAPTQLADILFEVGCALLAPLCDGTSFRLIGIGGSNLTAPDQADPLDLIEPARNKRKKAEQAMDQLTARFGTAAIKKGRGL